MTFPRFVIITNFGVITNCGVFQIIESYFLLQIEAVLQITGSLSDLILMILRKNSIELHYNIVCLRYVPQYTDVRGTGIRQCSSAY